MSHPVSISPKRVIIMGKGALAEKIVHWFHNSPKYHISYIIPNFPESSWTTSLRSVATELDYPIVESGKLTDIPNVKADTWSIDLVVSVTYDKIVKEWFIWKCKKIINIHNGPLPKYRGVNPINWALKNNEQEHGVTIHDITPGIDDGPIYNLVTFPIDPDADEVIDVYERSLNYGWQLFKKTIPHIWEIRPIPQDETLAQYYSQDDFVRLGERSFFTRQESKNRLHII